MLRDITTTFNAWAVDKDEFAKIQNALPGENQDRARDLRINKTKSSIWCC